MELQDQYSDVFNKHNNSEKIRIRLQNQVDTMTPEFEKVNLIKIQTIYLYSYFFIEKKKVQKTLRGID